MIVFALLQDKDGLQTVASKYFSQIKHLEKRIKSLYYSPKRAIFRA